MSSTPENDLDFINIESNSESAPTNIVATTTAAPVLNSPEASAVTNSSDVSTPVNSPEMNAPPAAVEENSPPPTPLTNANNNSQGTNFANVPSPEAAAPPVPPATTTVGTTTTVPPPPIPPRVKKAPVEAPAEAPAEAASNASNTTKTKKRRSTKQREADAGQKEMLERIREVYRKEFAEIPEKFRPKPKAYVARAAWYKKEGPERDKYIESWVLADKNAANARMGVNVGKKRLTEKNSYANEYVLDTLPSIVSEATNSAEKFKPSTETLRERAKKAIQKMNEITNKAHDQLMKRIKQPAVRRTATYLFKETRKLTKRLTAEINTQTRHLQKAAKDYIRRESLAAKGSLEKKANANLTAALGRRPAKRMTHRLTRLRNAGKGTSVKNFLNGENKHGRIPKTLKAKWKTGIPENATPLNAYND